jgi:hypothetical protein
MNETFIQEPKKNHGEILVVGIISIGHSNNMLCKYSSFKHGRFKQNLPKFKNLQRFVSKKR